MGHLDLTYFCYRSNQMIASYHAVADSAFKYGGQGMRLFNIPNMYLGQGSLEALGLYPKPKR